MKKCVGFLFAITAFFTLHAQNPADTLPRSVTLEDCIAYALVHQPVLQQARLDERLTDNDIRSRLADWFPQVGGTYGLQHVFQRQTSFFNGTATPVGVTNTSTAQLYVDQALFNRNLLLANRTQGDVRLQARQVTAAQQVDITAAVSKAFYDILTTQQQIKVANENIARLQRSISDAYYRYEAGVTDKTDYKRAQIALNNIVATRQTAEAAVTGKVENLKSLIGYPVQAPLAVVFDSLKMEQEAAFDTAQYPTYTNRIEYQQLQTAKRLQEANVKYQRNAYLPTVAANAGYNFNYLNNNFGKLYNDNYPNSFVGLTAGIPIFQGGKRRIAVRSAQLAVARVDLELQNLQNTINSQYAVALSTYKGSFANYRASRENVALAQEVYDVIQLQYRAGVKTYLEVITSETDLRNAQINYFNALYQVVASKVDAERALGLIPFN